LAIGVGVPENSKVAKEVQELKIKTLNTFFVNFNVWNVLVIVVLYFKI
jgi:hypothetical protein